MNICHSISFLLLIIFLLVSECGKGGPYPPNTHPNFRSGSPSSLLFGRRRKSSQTTSEKRAQKFYTDDALLPRSE